MYTAFYKSAKMDEDYKDTVHSITKNGQHHVENYVRYLVIRYQQECELHDWEQATHTMKLINYLTQHLWETSQQKQSG